MIETLTRPAATTTRWIAPTRLAAGAALGVAILTRIAALLTGTSSLPLLVLLPALSLLAFVVASEEPATGRVDERVTTMLRRAAAVQTVVGVAALAAAAF